MFSKADSKAGRAGAGQAAPSILSADLSVKGDVISDGEVHIDGVVDGDLRAKSLTVGQTGVVNGEISGKDVLIRGTVNGQITATMVTLADSARVKGDILHDSLVIELGAHLEGNCRRLDAKAIGRETAGGTINLVFGEGGPGKLTS